MNKVSLKPSAVVRVLALVALLLVIASLGGQFVRFVLGVDRLRDVGQLFNLDVERNIPTYFSELLLLLAAVLLAIIAILGHRQKISHVSKWVTLSVGFLLMAFDEAFEVHERLIVPVRDLIGVDVLGAFYYAWTIPAITLVVALGLFFTRFLLSLPSATRIRFLMAATIYLGGAIGLELVGGRYAELHGIRNWTYALITTAEEGLEMAGLILFIWALLKYFADTYKEVQFEFRA